MAKYIIVETWNGEGYSWLNKAYVKNFVNDRQAQGYIRNLIVDDECDTIKIMDGEITYTIGDDTGTCCWYTLHPEAYGVVIECNINVAEVVNKKRYDERWEEAVAQSDPDDEIEDGFIGAYDGDYDYQFIKL